MGYVCFIHLFIFFPNPLLNAFLAGILCQPFFYHTRWTQFFFNGNYLCSLRSNKVIQINLPLKLCFKKIYCLGLVLRDAGFKKQSKRVEQKTFSPAKKIVQQNRTHSTFTWNKKPCEHLMEVDSPFFEADNGIMNNFLQYFRRRDRLWFLFLWTFGQFNLLYPETILN